MIKSMFERSGHNVGIDAQTRDKRRQNLIFMRASLQRQLAAHAASLPVFSSCLTKEELQRLVMLFEPEVYIQGDCIASKTIGCDRIIIITQGVACAPRHAGPGGGGTYFHAGSWLGFTCLLRHRWEASVYATGNVDCWYLKQKELHAFLGSTSPPRVELATRLTRLIVQPLILAASLPPPAHKSDPWHADVTALEERIRTLAFVRGNTLYPINLAVCPVHTRYAPPPNVAADADAAAAASPAAVGSGGGGGGLSPASSPRRVHMGNRKVVLVPCAPSVAAAATAGGGGGPQRAAAAAAAAASPATRQRGGSRCGGTEYNVVVRAAQGAVAQEDAVRPGFAGAGLGVQSPPLSPRPPAVRRLQAGMLAVVARNVLGRSTESGQSGSAAASGREDSRDEWGTTSGGPADVAEVAAADAVPSSASATVEESLRQWCSVRPGVVQRRRRIDKADEARALQAVDWADGAAEVEAVDAAAIPAWQAACLEDPFAGGPLLSPPLRGSEEGRSPRCSPPTPGSTSLQGTGGSPPPFTAGADSVSGHHVHQRARADLCPPMQLSRPQRCLDLVEGASPACTATVVCERNYASQPVGRPGDATLRPVGSLLKRCALMSKRGRTAAVEPAAPRSRGRAGGAQTVRPSPRWAPARFEGESESPGPSLSEGEVSAEMVEQDESDSPFAL